MSAHLTTPTLPTPTLPSTPTPRANPWIASPRWDLAFFFGGPTLGVCAGGLALWQPAWVIPLWWAWLLLLDGPHLVATLWRTALDAPSRRQWAHHNLRALRWLLLGPSCLAASIALNTYAPFDLFLLFATLWSVHHAIRQHFGVLSLYHATTHTPPPSRSLDRWFLHASLWWLFCVFLLGHPTNRRLLDLPPSLDPTLTLTAQALTLSLALATSTYTLRLYRRARAGEHALPGLFTLLPSLASQALAYLWIGASEPLLPSPTDPEQYFLAVAVALGTAHSLEYFGVVLFYAKNRAERLEQKISKIARALSRRGWLAYAVWLAASSLYLLLLAARGNSPGWTLFDPSSNTARLFLALYWGIFFHHYDMDHLIWRPSADPDLRLDLRLQRPPSPAPTTSA